MASPKRCCIGISCRKDVIPREEADNNDKPIKYLVLLKNGVVLSRTAQIIVLPGQKGKHKRIINLYVSCEHRKNMTIKHIMNNVITW